LRGQNCFARTRGNNSGPGGRARGWDAPRGPLIEPGEFEKKAIFGKRPAGGDGMEFSAEIKKNEFGQIS